MEPVMFQSDDLSGAPQLDFEAWRDLLRTMCGRYNPEGTEPDAFSGWVRPGSVYGFTALDIACNAERIERTYRDARLDSVAHYFLVFQVAGPSAISHNDQAAQLAVGDIALVDAARPMTYFSNNGNEAWNTLTLNLPRESLVSHLGFEPQGGLYRPGGTPAGRLLFSLIRDADQAEGSALSPADSYMQLAIYDLVGALFAPSEPWLGSRYPDKLFTRIRGIIKDGFADPDFGPNEVAAETGISLRYLQKLFTERGSTCRELIFSLRLDHSARLINRRASLGTSQPLIIARSPTPVAFATILISHESFAIGSVTPQGPIQNNLIALAIE
jgi:AraC family transcriptional regulator, positive regulator of tynA and feaB